MLLDTGEEPEVPKVEKAKVSKTGELALNFNQDMLLDEIFAGFTFSSGTTQEPKTLGRRLDNLDLSSLV